MHFPIPTIITTTTTTINTLLAATLLPLLATGQQLGANETICQFLYGTDYRDACCHTVISRGVNAPCTDIEYVRNLTECGIRHYPTGWAVCVEKVRKILFLFSFSYGLVPMLMECEIN
jgi:hypothetical protein